MLIALLIIAVLGCIVRGYYMFMVGFDLDTRSYSTYLTSIIAIPTGIKILNWLATIWSSCFSSITPLYFIIGFPFSSTFGGFTGPFLFIIPYAFYWCNLWLGINDIIFYWMMLILASD